MKEKDFTTYEYAVRTVKAKYRAYATDMYEAFGWEITDSKTSSVGTTTLLLKRARDLLHRQEMNRLERQAEEVLSEIGALERSKTLGAKIFSYVFGSFSALIFGGGMSLVMLSDGDIARTICGALTGIVGIILCSVNYQLYRKLADKKSAEIVPLVCDYEEKFANILEKGNDLLTAENI